jgi:hypothetical protein
MSPSSARLLSPTQPPTRAGRPTLPARNTGDPVEIRKNPCRNYCFRQSVPLDHWIRLSGRMTPSMFHGPPTLMEILLVSVPRASSPLSLFKSRLVPDCVIVKVRPLC